MAGPDWRIYYFDGSTFDSLDGAPIDAPGLGVVCIVQRNDDVGRTVTAKFDWYYWSPGNQEFWGSTDTFSVLTYITQRASGHIDGRTLCQGWHSPDYAAIMQRATTDADFPRKSGSLPRERPTRSF